MHGFTRGAESEESEDAPEPSHAPPRASARPVHGSELEVSALKHRVRARADEKFMQRRIRERYQEVGRLSNGFVMGGRFNPGPVHRGTLGLMRSRFDLSGLNERDRGIVGPAFDVTNPSPSHTRLMMSVAHDHLGRMFRNARRLREQNLAREAFNRTGPRLRPLAPRSDPTRALGAEQAKVGVAVHRGKKPGYSPSSNSISVMVPEHLDAISHELRHAYDHTHGVLDGSNRDHALASELNAFTQQDHVAREVTGRPPAMFEGRTPQQMAESYEGKEGKGYKGTLKESLRAVDEWRKRRHQGPG